MNSSQKLKIDRPSSIKTRPEQDKKDDQHHVVVVGGGFGGLWAVRSLRKAPVKITLVDKRNFHLFQPLLYQVATGGISPADIASPLRGILRRQKNVSVEMDEMTDIDYDNQRVILRSGELSYDTLIVAVGSENHYYGNDNWEDNAPGLKSIEDALNIRRRIFGVFEAAEKEPDPEKRRRLLTFVIIGGGPTGVELAGAVGEIANINLKNDFRNINTADTKIILLEGADRILLAFPDSLSRAAVKSLKKLGVETRTNVMVKDIDNNGVVAEDSQGRYHIDAETIMWAAGVRPSPLGKVIAKNDKSLLDKAGRIKVASDLSVPGRKNVFIIGDLANYSHQTGDPLPGTAPVAMSQGRYVAGLITDRLKGRQAKAYHYRDKGNLAVIGRASAVADLGIFKASGYPAWLLWLFVHLMYMVEYDNRLLVFIQFAWNYFTRKRGARLITYDIKYNDTGKND